ncbi:MAG: fructose-bisphosphate aldolase [Chloroflexi bacterium]|nr:fructose-bisphosphate aldolase [Chloroflexota bacterium]
MNLNAPGRNLVIVAMDHGRTHGFIEGLETPGKVIDEVIETGADAIMTTFGVVKHFRERLIGRIPTIMRLDGGPSLYREDWKAYSEWKLLHSVEDALLLGADAVIVNLFVGIEAELASYQVLARVAGECLRTNLPVIVEAIPCPSERVPDPFANEAAASAARLAFEHGADFVKTYYTGEGFEQVIGSCPVPVLIAGGPKMDSVEESLQVASDALQAGARGVVFGRNIWQSTDAGGVLSALKCIVHHNGSVSDALKELAQT